jgi:hypothetical protein
LLDRLLAHTHLFRQNIRFAVILLSRIFSAIANFTLRLLRPTSYDKFGVMAEFDLCKLGVVPHCKFEIELSHRSVKFKPRTQTLSQSISQGSTTNRPANQVNAQSNGSVKIDLKFGLAALFIYDGILSKNVIAKFKKHSWPSGLRR